MPILPVVRGLYVCERVDVDPVSKNVSLANCFRGLRLADMPSMPQPFYVFALLANGLGEMTIRTTINDLDAGPDIFRHTARIRLTNRLTELRFKLTIDCLFPRANSYNISLFVDDELIALTPIVVSRLEDFA